jgi:hypothetical protein
MFGLLLGVHRTLMLAPEALKTLLLVWHWAEIVDG